MNISASPFLVVIILLEVVDKYLILDLLIYLLLAQVSGQSSMFLICRNNKVLIVNFKAFGVANHHHPKKPLDNCCREEAPFGCRKIN